MQRADRVDATAGERPLRADDERGSRGVGAQRVERLTRGDADAAALSGREPPDAVVTAELAAGLVDDRPRGAARRPCTLEERAVVAAGEEARFLALRARRAAARPGCGRLGTRGVLRLLAEREVDAVESAGGTVASMYDWSLRGVGAAGDEAEAVPFGDARVVAGPEPLRPGALREGEQRVEAEGAVAADAGFGVRPRAYAVDERRDDGAAELLAQVERHVRQPERVAGLAAATTAAGEQHARSASARAGRARVGA